MVKVVKCPSDKEIREFNNINAPLYCYYVTVVKTSLSEIVLLVISYLKFNVLLYLASF